MDKKELYKHFDLKFENSFLRIRLKGAKEYKMVPPKMDPIYLCQGIERMLSKDDISAYGENDIIMKTNSEELYRLYLSEQEYCQFAFGYDARTRKCFEEMRIKSGLLKSLYEWDEEVLNETTTFTSLEKHSIGWNSRNIEIGETENRWIVEFSRKDAIIEHFLPVRMYFSQRPSKENIENLCDMERLEELFSKRQISATFYCWICGDRMHWLDIEGNFRKKVEGVRQKNCGCRNKEASK